MMLGLFFKMQLQHREVSKQECPHLFGKDSLGTQLFLQIKYNMSVYHIWVIWIIKI
jgi:hypothetical protein